MSSSEQLPMQPVTISRTNSAMQEAVDLCLEKNEKPLTAARMYGLNPSSVRAALARRHNHANRAQRQGPAKHGGSNEVLREDQEVALFRYVTDEADEGLGVSKKMLFAAICHLRRKEHKPDPSWRWFQMWLKSQEDKLHVIRTKPISMARMESHTDKTVQDWFAQLHVVMEEKDIRRARQIYNFDDTGVRVGCPGSEEVLFPNSIKEKYTSSPENRVSVSIIEAIYADGSQPPPPAIICPGKKHMENWFHENRTGDEMVMLSDTGYTDEQLSLEWLRHFIKHTRAGPSKKWKLLLMDGHKSHNTPEFTLLAIENHIQPFVFPSHLTHILQPLDVGVFRPWKHWHKMAIQNALHSLDFEYSKSSLFRDLTSIRDSTFKPRTIINSYAEAGIWPVSCKQALQKMRQYNGHRSTEQAQSEEPGLPSTPRTPKTLHENQMSMEECENRIPDPASPEDDADLISTNANFVPL